MRLHVRVPVLSVQITVVAPAKRIIDFISGTTYALSGDIKKVGKNVFMCAPNNVSVNFTEELKKPSSSTTMPWEE